VPAAGRAWIVTGENGELLRSRDRATGVVRWAYRIRGGHFAAAPVVDRGTRVLVGTTDRRSLPPDARKGSPTWTWKVGAEVQNAGSLLGGRLVVPSYDAVLYGLNAGNGNMEWRAPLPSRPLSGPMFAHDSVLVACYENDVVGFSGRTGQKLGG